MLLRYRQIWWQEQFFVCKTPCNHIRNGVPTFLEIWKFFTYTGQRKSPENFRKLRILKEYSNNRYNTLVFLFPLYTCSADLWFTLFYVKKEEHAANSGKFGEVTIKYQEMCVSFLWNLCHGCGNTDLYLTKQVLEKVPLFTG